MGKFRFSLQRVLDVREKEEEKAIQEWREAYHLCYELHRQREALNRSCVDYWEGIMSQQRKGFSLSRALLSEMVNRYYLGREEELGTALEEAGSTETRKREELTECRLRKRSLELLKNRQLETYLGEERRREWKELDDHILMKREPGMATKRKSGS